jgi:hypothetical protein
MVLTDQAFSPLFTVQYDTTRKGNQQEIGPSDEVSSNLNKTSCRFIQDSSPCPLLSSWYFE